jgi:preprotein translocase subunit SecG
MNFVGYLLMFLLIVLAMFLIVLILIQRGKGGGLAGALGGMGGQSAFGTKAGDLFMWITVGTVGVWLVLCVVTALWFRNEGDMFQNPTGGVQQESTDDGSGPAAPADGNAPAAPDEGNAPAAPAADGSNSAK